jgi:hypothetical protein
MPGSEGSSNQRRLRRRGGARQSPDQSTVHSRIHRVLRVDAAAVDLLPVTLSNAYRDVQNKRGTMMSWVSAELWRELTGALRETLGNLINIRHFLKEIDTGQMPLSDLRRYRWHRHIARCCHA